MHQKECRINSSSSMFPHVSCPLHVILTLTPRLLLLLGQRSAPKYRDAVRAQTWGYFQFMTETRQTPNTDVSFFHNSLGLIRVTSRSCGPPTLPLCPVTPKICLQYEHTRQSKILWFVHIRWQAPRDSKDNGLNNRSNNVWELLFWIQGSEMRRWQGL